MLVTVRVQLDLDMACRAVMRVPTRKAAIRHDSAALLTRMSSQQQHLALLIRSRPLSQWPVRLSCIKFLYSLLQAVPDVLLNASHQLFMLQLLHHLGTKGVHQGLAGLLVADTTCPEVEQLFV